MAANDFILIVDDDEGIREFVANTLGDEGYCTEIAAHGLQALDVIRRHVPRLILLDMRMPVMNGWEFMRAYRETPGPHAPIVILTAAHGAVDSALRVEADGCLAKPFDLDELIDLVGRYMTVSCR